MVALVLSSGTFWTAEEGIIGKVAAAADMWELAGTGGTPRRTVKSEAHGPGPGLLAGRVGTRAGAVAVVGAGADNTVRFS